MAHLLGGAKLRLCKAYRTKSKLLIKALGAGIGYHFDSPGTLISRQANSIRD